MSTGGSGDDEYRTFGGSILITDSGGGDSLRIALPFFRATANLAAIDASMEAFTPLPPSPDDESGALQESSFVAQEGADLVFTSQSWRTASRFRSWKSGSKTGLSQPKNRIEHVTVADADDFVLTAAQFEAWGGLHIGGDSADEMLDASDTSDRAFGMGGDDFIATGDGNDRISGGAGNDELHGGSGDDTYYYAQGDGDDLIQDISAPTKSASARASSPPT